MSRLLELDLLRTLVVVSDCGSFTRAAEILNRTQAAVSMQIRRLEELCDRPLISRSKREFRLTDEGEALVAHGKRMLQLNEAAFDSLAPGDVSGTVRLAVPDLYATQTLPPLLAQFSNEFPNVQIELQSGVTQIDVEHTLQGLHFDLLIAVEPADTTAGVVLSRERAIWATAVRNSPHTKSPLPLALLREGTLLRFWALSHLGERGRDWRETCVSASSLAVLACIEAGLAVGVIREGSLRPAMRELTEADGFRPLPRFDITLLHPKAGLGRAARALYDFLLKHLRSPDVRPL